MSKSSMMRGSVRKRCVDGMDDGSDDETGYSEWEDNPEVLFGGDDGEEEDFFQGVAISDQEA